MSLSKNISRKATKSTIFNIKGRLFAHSNININIYIIVLDFDCVFSILTNDK